MNFLNKIKTFFDWDEIKRYNLYLSKRFKYSWRYFFSIFFILLFMGGYVLVFILSELGIFFNRSPFYILLIILFFAFFIYSFFIISVIFKPSNWESILYFNKRLANAIKKERVYERKKFYKKALFSIKNYYSISKNAFSKEISLSLYVYLKKILPLLFISKKKELINEIYLGLIKLSSSKDFNLLYINLKLFHQKLIKFPEFENIFLIDKVNFDNFDFFIEYLKKNFRRSRSLEILHSIIKYIQDHFKAFLFVLILIAICLGKISQINLF